MPEFFRNFWVRRMALDRRNYRQLVETTVEIANKVLSCASRSMSGITNLSGLQIILRREIF